MADDDVRALREVALAWQRIPEVRVIDGPLQQLWGRVHDEYVLAYQTIVQYADATRSPQLGMGTQRLPDRLRVGPALNWVINSICTDLRQALSDANFGPTGVPRLPAAIHTLLAAAATMYSRHPNKGWHAAASSSKTISDVGLAQPPPPRAPRFREARPFIPRVIQETRDLDDILAGIPAVAQPLPAVDTHALELYDSMPSPGFVIAHQSRSVLQQVTQAYVAACALCDVHPRTMVWVSALAPPFDLNKVFHTWYRRAGAILDEGVTIPEAPIVAAFRTWFDTSPAPWQRLWKRQGVAARMDAGAARSGAVGAASPRRLTPSAAPAMTGVNDTRDSSGDSSTSWSDFAPVDPMQTPGHDSSRESDTGTDEQGIQAMMPTPAHASPRVKDADTDDQGVKATGSGTGDHTSGRAADIPSRGCSPALPLDEVMLDRMVPDDGSHADSDEPTREARPLGVSLEDRPDDVDYLDYDGELAPAEDLEWLPGEPSKQADVVIAPPTYQSRRAEVITAHQILQADMDDFLGMMATGQLVRDPRRAFDIGTVATPVTMARARSAEEPVTDDEIPSLTSAPTGTSSDGGERG